MSRHGPPRGARRRGGQEENRLPHASEPEGTEEMSRDTIVLIQYFTTVIEDVKPGRFTGGNRTQVVTSSNSIQRIVTCVVAVTF